MQITAAVDDGVNEPVFAGNYYRNFQEEEAWQAGHAEAILEPDLAIVDAHHHLVDNKHGRYLFADYLKDINSGHRIVASVYVQAFAMFRKDGPEHLRPIGETEFVRGMSAMGASGTYGETRVCHGIVGYADLRRHETTEATLRAHIEAGGGRFRGIRQPAPSASGKLATALPFVMPPHMLRDVDFRKGFAHLAPLGLSFDAWLFHPQLDDVVDLARAFPDTAIIVNHLGGRIVVGPHAVRVEEVNAGWRDLLTQLAACPNVSMKVGGQGMLYGGTEFHLKDRPPSSEELAEVWRPLFETTIDIFGPGRCMFESNFPQDKQSCSYHVLWNTFKRVAAELGYSEDEKADLFRRNAQRIYRLDPVV